MRAYWRHLANTIELVLPSAHPSPQPKRHLDQLSRFCRAHYCDRPTDHAIRSVTTGRVYLRSRPTAMRPNKTRTRKAHRVKTADLCTQRLTYDTQHSGAQGRHVLMTDHLPPARLFTSHTCLYSPAAEHHITLAGTYFQSVDMSGWIYNVAKTSFPNFTSIFSQNGTFPSVILNSDVRP